MGLGFGIWDLGFGVWVQDYFEEPLRRWAVAVAFLDYGLELFDLGKDARLSGGGTGGGGRCDVGGAFKGRS